MPTVNFAKAQARRRQVLICLIGESSSGKTYSALLLAWGLARGLKKDGVPYLLDTENGRGEAYSDDDTVGGYIYGELTPPFTPERFIEGIGDAAAAGADVLVTDTFSHEWEGLGGIIDIADNSKTKAGDALSGLAKWSGPKGRHKKLMHFLGRNNLHHILALRAKDDMVQEDQVDDKGLTKKTIVNKGKKSVQEKRFKFEMTVQIIMEDGEDREGYYRVSKCPKNLRHIFKTGDRITMKTGEMLANWANNRKPIDHALEKLRLEGETAAAGGKEAFLKWWQSKPVEAHRKNLKQFSGNFESIVKASDDDKARAKADAATQEKTDTQAARSKTAPFGDDPANPKIDVE